MYNGGKKDAKGRTNTKEDAVKINKHKRDREGAERRNMYNGGKMTPKGRTSTKEEAIRMSQH